MYLLLTLLPLLDPVPDDDDVVAGPWGALLFVGLILAVAVLSFSFAKQLRKTRANRDAGVFGDPPASDSDDDRSRED